MIQTFRARKKKGERERERAEKYPAVSVHVHSIHRLGSDKRGQRLERKDGESLRGRNVTAACPRAPLLSKLIRRAKGMMKLTVARGHGKADAEPLHLRCIKAIHPDAWRTCIHRSEMLPANFSKARATVLHCRSNCVRKKRFDIHPRIRMLSNV